MEKGFVIKSVLLRITENIKRRPLILPALAAILLMLCYYALRPGSYSSGDIALTGTIRQVELRLDGTSSVVINTQEYGRILYRGTVDDVFIPGDRVYIEGKLKVYKAPTNPGEFDYASYLRRKGISGVLYPDHLETIEEGPSVFRLSYTISKAFLKLRRFTLSVFEEEDRGLAAALFMGDTSLLEDETTRAFRLSNCSHLLAVSGTHFAGFMLILTEVLSKRHIKRKKAFLIYTVFCLLVGTFTGWSESVTRAAVISICGMLSRDYQSGLSLAAIILMVNDPYSCLSSGFQMSFTAALAIRLFAERLGGALKKLHLPKTVVDLLSPTLAATIGMMPFFGRNCYYFSCMHIVVQVFASLLATIACIFFIPSVITGLPYACALVLYILKWLMLWCSSFSLDQVSSDSLSPMLIYSVFSLLCLYLMPFDAIRRLLKGPVALLALISVLVLINSYLHAPRATVIFIDVGQGDSCLIMSEGRSILIDGGVEAEGRYSVSSVLDYYGIDSVDLAVASHMDEDHIGGLNYLASQGRIENFLTCYDLRKGDEIRFTEDIIFTVLWPERVTDGGNEDSVVLRLDYNDFSILYTGDIGFRSESILIDEGADIDTDILKVGHHGSAYSTSEEFLEAVSPDTAVISVVENSPYGHPAPETLRRLEEYGCDIRRTDLEGAVLIELY
ncbi:MAG: DNA internalization-related competence protein ComEC/Rec2 [Clostridiales bacterium]|nr:DNA internalization-related competence protein ComEC/Rec2 [Clostridiales bacterium]